MGVMGKTSNWILVDDITKMCESDNILHCNNYQDIGDNVGDVYCEGTCSYAIEMRKEQQEIDQKRANELGEKARREARESLLQRKMYRRLQINDYLRSRIG